MGVMEDRRRIIAAQPHLVTASGSSVLVNIAETKIERLRVTFSPVQTGSGTPSPSNVRPIMGWATIAASIGTMPVDISLGGTYYGGTVDLVSGVMMVTHEMETVSNLLWTYESSYTRFVAGIDNFLSNSGMRTTRILADKFQPIDDGRAIASVPDYSVYCGSANKYVYVRVPSTYATVPAFKAEFGDSPIVYPLASPVTVTLTPQTIAALRGQQTVTSPAGAVEISYWTH